MWWLGHFNGLTHEFQWITKKMGMTYEMIWRKQQNVMD
jgi:hypothetical protein